jgi:hypothetical protein
MAPGRAGWRTPSIEMQPSAGPLASDKKREPNNTEHPGTKARFFPTKVPGRPGQVAGR